MDAGTPEGQPTCPRPLQRPGRAGLHRPSHLCLLQKKGSKLKKVASVEEVDGDLDAQGGPSRGSVPRVDSGAGRAEASSRQRQQREGPGRVPGSSRGRHVAGVLGWARRPPCPQCQLSAGPLHVLRPSRLLERGAEGVPT